jgi:uncharacterized membrane protein
MVATVMILLLWIGFAGTHIGLSSGRLRPQLVAGLGESLFRGVYSLIAFAFFIPLVWTYLAHKHAGPLLWMPRGWLLRLPVFLGMTCAFVLLLASLARPSPVAFLPGDPRPRGVQRIARHPLFMAFGMFGLLHLLVNGSTADIVFFGGFVVFVLVGGWHQDQRKLAAATPEVHAFYEATPFLPFTGGATLQGLSEIPPGIIAGGIVLAMIVRYFHASWFGG